MRRWSVQSVPLKGCVDRGGPGGLAQAGEDPSDAVLVADGIAVEHGVDGKYDVVAELVRGPAGRLDPMLVEMPPITTWVMPRRRS